MSVQAQVARLEDLLTRVQKNRTEGPTASFAGLAAAPIAAAAAAPEVPSPSLSHSAAPPDVSPSRAPKPTPMEMALLQESEEPEVEVTVDVDFEEPEIVIGEESIPTAPVGTRAPVQMPEPATGKRAALAATPVRLAPTAAPSTPVARVVSRAEPRTFGELLERTLALRPR